MNSNIKAKPMTKLNIRWIIGVLAILTSFAVSNGSAQTQALAQEAKLHPYWAPRTWQLRPDDITTVMGFRAELSGNLAVC